MVTKAAPIPALLTSWTSGPASPVLTWYGPEAERVELTGGVLANWVTKATNLLQDEAEAAPGVTVGLDLPAHWRTLVWALAVWNCGAAVALPEWHEEVDVQVSAAAAPPPAPLTIAVALPALAREVAELPAGAIDGAAELMAQPDVVVFSPEWDPQAPAFGSIRHADLADPRALSHISVAAQRYLLAPKSAAETIATCTAVWFAGGSVVLVGDHDVDTERVAQQEDARPLTS